MLYFCDSLLPAFMSGTECKVIFNNRAVLLNEPLLMQHSVSNIKDKEVAPVALQWHDNKICLNDSNV